MKLGLEGKRAVVTGGSAGIGLAIAHELAAEGCGLVLVSRTATALEAARDAIRRSHDVPVDVLALDLSRDESVDALVGAAGDADIVVNNAGAIPGGGITDVDQARWRAAWDLKVFGFIGVTRAFYSRMQARRRGVILNVIGASATASDAGYIAGSAGNAALEALTRALGSASPAHDVRVLGVSPGVMRTERLDKLLKERAQQRFGDPARWPDLVKRFPFGRMGRPEEVAATVAFLVSDRASYISGTIVTVDGGQSQRHDWWG